MAIQTIDRGTAGNPSDTFKLGEAFDTCQANDNYLDSIKPTIVETFAALAATPVTAGAVYYLKEYYASTGLGGGKLVGKAGSTTYDNVLTFAGTGGYFERINYDCLTPQMAGSTDDATDNMAQLDALAAACSDKLVPLFQPIDEYLGVSGNFELPDNLKIYGLKLKQLTPAASTRTIFKNSGSGFIELHNCAVNRNGTADVNDLQIATDAAGVWLHNIAGVIIDGLEVFGHGQGTGIRLINLTGRLKFKGFYVHDMTWWSSTAPVTEKLGGVSIENCDRWTMSDFEISNLYSKTGTDPVRRFQTDGIGVGGNVGSTRFTIKSGIVQNVGEGIDITGSGGNRDFRLFDIKAEDCGFASFKFANGNGSGHIFGCTSLRAGWVGIAVVGSGGISSQYISDFIIESNFIYDTGVNPEISGGSITYDGIQIGETSAVAGTPANVIVDKNIIIDRQTVKTMNFGIKYYGAIATGQNIIIRPTNIISGYTTKAVASDGGTNVLGEFMYSRYSTTGTFTHNSTGNWITYAPTNKDYDENNLYSAGTFTVKNRGQYVVTAGAVFISSVTGQRGIRIKKGATVQTSVIIDATAGSQATPCNLSHEIFLDAGDTIVLEIFQSSGGNLDLSNTGSFVRLSQS